MRILIVEDEAGIVRALERGLRAHGHEVVGAATGEDALVLAADEAVDFVLLDISLPKLDGHEVLARIRRDRPRLPVLMLTARDDLPNKVRAFEGGADDYLTKPFAFEELLARIRARARDASERQAAVVQAGDMRIDAITRLAWRGEKPVELPSREFTLLECFMRHPGQTLSRQALLASVWKITFDPGSNLVDVYVGYLRRRIDRPGEPSLITTVRGAGYRFDPAYT
jgi:two-component system OmpR family response regulator